MARPNRIIDASIDEVETAKQTAYSMMQNSLIQKQAEDLFFTDNLDEIENGLKKLNEISTNSWMLSALILYTIIYNKGLYEQSGLTWDNYLAESKDRIGIDKRTVADQLCAARFFILNQKTLVERGFTFVGNTRKLIRAEYATELCGDKNLVIDHLINDSWKDFNDWYSSFKIKKLITTTDHKRDDIKIDGNKFIIGKVEAIKISDKIPEDDKERLQDYIKQIFDAIQNGYEPAIVPVYDKKEAAILPRLRDKYRQGK